MSMRLPDAASPTDEAPVTRADLSTSFQRWGKPPERWRVGAEFEKVVVHRATGKQVTFWEEPGIETLLRGLSRGLGWNAYEEVGHTVALARQERCGKATVTLEPGGQVELSTPPCVSLFDMVESLQRHVEEVQNLLPPEQAVLAIGFTPFSTVDEVPLTVRERHRIMSNYLPQRGHLALHMMKGTSSVQCALDYADEEDAGRKAFCALSLSAIGTAMFANSPLDRGQATGLVSFRGRIWQNTDPQRSGLLADIVRDGDFSFDRWIDYLLDVPMMFYALGDRWLPAQGRTFRDYMATGYEGHFPTQEDWEIHLTSVFPEVRLKQFVEVRGADAVGSDLAVTFPGLWKGILYDQQALEDALRLARTFPAEDRAGLFDVAITRGLEGQWKGRLLADIAREMLEISTEGLRRQSQASGRRDESVVLDPLRALLNEGQSPGAQFLSRGDLSPAAVVKWFEY